MTEPRSHPTDCPDTATPHGTPASGRAPAGPAPTPAWPYVAVSGGTGHFSLARPRVEDVDARWIAAALARLPRWNGHTVAPYTVAQHTVWCAELAWEKTGDAALALGVLLHDAHEAAIGDIPTPVKRRLFELGLDERRWRCFLLGVDQAIYAGFGLAYPLVGAAARAVAELDALAMVTEWRDLVADPKPPLVPATGAGAAALPAPREAPIRAWQGSAEECASIWLAYADHWARLAGLEAPALEWRFAARTIAPAPGAMAAE